MKLEQVKPLGQNALVKLLPLYSSGQCSGGLILIDQKKHWDHKTRRGEVIAVGPRTTQLAPGDVVLFKGGEGRWVDDPEAGCAQDEARYLMVEEKNVLAVFDKEDKAA
jgi:co-chaperonin GroES (HSP10)